MACSQKKWVGEGRTILFVDESGFYLLPSVVRTWSPVGYRPILREWVSRDHLSAIAGISEAGQLYLLQQERAFDGEGVVGFLKHLLEHISGRLGIVWDAAPIHRGEAMRQFLAEGGENGAERIELAMLPGSILPTSTLRRGYGATSRVCCCPTLYATICLNFGMYLLMPSGACSATPTSSRVASCNPVVISCQCEGL